MRRLVLTFSCAASLIACASILGDFDVVPDAGTSDGAPTDGNSATDGPSSSSSGGEGGPGSDSGADAGTQPIPQEVAVNQYATCVTLKYGPKLVSLCWGATNPAQPQILGVGPTDQKVGNVFSAPHIPGTANNLVLDPPISTGSGSWFMASSTDGSQGAQAKNAYAWGSNLTAETGQDGGSTPTLPHVLKDTGNGPALSFVSASGGQHHGCLIDSVARLYCWGKNDACQSTTGSAVTGCVAPSDPIPNPEVIPVGSLPKNEAPATVAVGQSHTCMIAHGTGVLQLKTGNVYCWGGNTSEQAGQGVSASVPVPTTPSGLPLDNNLTKMELASGDTHSCAIIGSDLWCWGDNTYGQVQPGFAGGTRPAVKISNAFFANTDLSLLTLGGTATCAAFAATGGLAKTHAACFGKGPLGRAADKQTDPVAIVAGIEDIQGLAMSNTHGCAIARPDGGGELGLYCWGNNQAQAVDPTSTEPEIDQPRRILFPPL
jgi:hypothetical protein